MKLGLGSMHADAYPSLSQCFYVLFSGPTNAYSPDMGYMDNPQMAHMRGQGKIHMFYRSSLTIAHSVETLIFHSAHCSIGILAQIELCNKT